MCGRLALLVGFPQQFKRIVIWTILIGTIMQGAGTEFEGEHKDPALIVPLLRLERLSPSVLIALFQGIPTLVWCEEPHHGVQFGVQENRGGGFIIPVRDASGHLVISGSISNTQLPVPFRTGGRRVVAVAQLRKDIIKKDQDLSTQPGMPHLPAQTGYAISVLNPPWRQRFQNAGGTFTGGINITSAVERPELSVAIKSLLP